jgi:DNA/RNA-binding domain of Phe-tRNA-synthetase-like protein
MLTVSTDLDLGFTALELRELEVTAPRVDFQKEVASVIAAVRSGELTDTQPARRLYRRFGIDPTRYRPASEALLRRVRRGDPLPRVNSLVDVANLMSLQLQVPVGLYDLDQTDGTDLMIRIGTAREGYTGIGKERVNVEGKICVADLAGPCGNPSSDSARTQITTSTENAAWIYFLPVDEDGLNRTAELVALYGRGLVRVP